ncbi:MAG: hypothetical protein HC769_16025 [Cyanobacteria bacterium CRU_2_1]|nr:hypothetical protein [Cyanobacteria bacterium RU_5_0]NJR60205.1 hypothetical protein [Cyanobacteria bacterium CRU_2_1]
MDCPYCSNRVIRHIQHHQIYWFCRNCWQRFSDSDLEAINLSSPFPTVFSSEKSFNPRMRPSEAARSSNKPMVISAKENR